MLGMATILDPRFKTKSFRLDDNKKTAISAVTKELTEVYNTSNWQKVEFPVLQRRRRT